MLAHVVVSAQGDDRPSKMSSGTSAAAGMLVEICRQGAQHQRGRARVQHWRREGIEGDVQRVQPVVRGEQAQRRRPDHWSGIGSRVDQVTTAHAHARFELTGYRNHCPCQRPIPAFAHGKTKRDRVLRAARCRKPLEMVDHDLVLVRVQTAAAHVAGGP